MLDSDGPNVNDLLRTPQSWADSRATTACVRPHARDGSRGSRIRTWLLANVTSEGFTPGSHVGANALIADRVRTATVTAETELRTWVMTIWDFRSFVQSDGEIAWKLLEELAKQVAPSHTS